MKSRVSALVVPLSLLVLVCLIATPAHSQQTRFKIDRGPVSLDGPVGIDGVFPVSAQQTPTIILAEYEFNDPAPNEANCLPQGWTGHDLNQDYETYFHVDDFFGLGGSYAPLAGAQSLWCGARPATTPPLCLYSCLPGYGNSWDQGWCTSNCLPVIGNVTLTFDMQWDMEPGYDYVAVEYDECDDNWIQFGGGVGTYDGTGTVAASHVINGANHSGSVRIRIRVISDGAFSNEDCLFPTDGAAIIDNLGVSDAGGTVLATEDFEGEALGAQASDDWEACLPSAYGDFSCLFPGTDAEQEVGSADYNATCAWGFFCASTSNYTCGGFPSQQTVPYKNSSDLYIYNEIWSPWITFSGPASYTTHMDFDVYRDLTVDALVFYDWKVRTRSVPGGCPDFDWQTDNFVYYGGNDWYTHTADMDNFMGPNPAEIQVALGVIDMCRFWCGYYGTGACHSHSPMFDNVTVYRKNTQSWFVDESNLFQDAFPTDATTTGTIRMDTPSGDYARVQATEPEHGIDYLVPGDPGSGPAVFLHVGNLPGKSGAIVSGGGQWPEVPAMSTPDWTVLQMSALSKNHTYLVDVNDALYVPGDVVRFYFSARDGGGGVSYYSHLIGQTDDEAVAQANPMEATCLPGAGLAASGILYVDYYNGYGAQPYFETAFDALSLEVDRFDRRASSSEFNNSLGDAVQDTEVQAGPYDIIIWNTGTFGKLDNADYGLLYFWLDQSTSNRGLYLTGDNIASSMAASNNVSAQAIVSDYIDYTVTNVSHIDAGEPVSPLVIGETGGIFDHGDPDTTIALGALAMLEDFDVIQPSGTAVLEASYSGDPLQGAVISQSTTNSQQADANVVLSGFSFHHIRDDRPGPGGGSAVIDRHDHLHDILEGLGLITPNPTGAGDDPRFATTLAQNVPNPFNPTTTISYSLQESSPVRIVVYDVSGARVRTLVDIPNVSAGQYMVDWDGTNEHGRQVASGVYFYRMTASDFTRTRKMVMLK